MIPGFLAILSGIALLLINTLFLKKGKVLVFPWRKALYGRRMGWWIRRDDLDDWSLYWNYIFFDYIFSVVLLVAGILYLLWVA